MRSCMASRYMYMFRYPMQLVIFGTLDGMTYDQSTGVKRRGLWARSQATNCSPFPSNALRPEWIFLRLAWDAVHE